MQNIAPLLLAVTASLGQGEPAAEPQTEPKQQTVIVAVGAAGSDVFGEQFRNWAERWRATTKRAEAKWRAVGLDDEEATDRDLLQRLIKEEDSDSSESLRLVLIGHGTFDGRRAKFNLRGPDVTAEELSVWLKPLRRPVAVINCTSASGPFVNRLSAPGRVVVTSTKSGFEHNYSRFGNYLSLAIADQAADLDKDGQTSLLEAFLKAASGVAEFYKEEGRLATEHALLDDNGDQLGTTADWYRGVRATRAAKDGAEVDGLRAGQFHLVRSDRERKMSAALRRRRDQLERDIDELRKTKQQLDENDYYQQLEQLALELARLYDSADQVTSPPSEH